MRDSLANMFVCKFQAEWWILIEEIALGEEHTASRPTPTSVGCRAYGSFVLLFLRIMPSWDVVTWTSLDFPACNLNPGA